MTRSRGVHDPRPGEACATRFAELNDTWIGLGLKPQEFIDAGDFVVDASVLVKTTETAEMEEEQRAKRGPALPRGAG
jgi:hypothetical protein